MWVSVKEINTKEGRRRLDAGHVEELADSIRELGLLNPITIDKENNLIAGLHRLEAVKRLGWAEVECTVSSLEGLQAELAEIDENFVRSGLSAVEYGEMLLRRKEIYEMLHPETKATYDGGAFRGNQHKNVVTDKMSPTIKSFVQDTADKLGVVPRTVERQIWTARNLAPEAKEIIRSTDTKVSKKTAMELSRLEPERQKEAAALLAAGEIRKVGEYTAKAEKTSGVAPETEKQGAAEAVGEKALVPGQWAGEDKQTPTMELGGSVSHGYGETDLQKPQSEQIPISTDTVSGNSCASLKEIIAELKDPDKDCSGTPASFLQEYEAFVRKFHKEIGWYSDPYYDAVYPLLTDGQLTELRGMTDSICSAAEALFEKVEKERKGR